jgi:hypothetical protein
MAQIASSALSTVTEVLNSMAAGLSTIGDAFNCMSPSYKFGVFYGYTAFGVRFHPISLTLPTDTPQIAAYLVYSCASDIIQAAQSGLPLSRAARAQINQKALYASKHLYVLFSIGILGEAWFRDGFPTKLSSDLFRFMLPLWLRPCRRFRF